MRKILLLFFFVSSLFANNFEISTKNISQCKNQICKNILNHYANFMKKIEHESFIRKLELINSYLNSLMPRYDDFYNTNVDVWSTRSEFLRRGGGDCEEYAISKRDSLKDLGVDNQKCLLVVQEKNTKKYHMVLAVWENLHKEPLILDNLSFRVLPLSKRYDLVPEYCLMDGKYFKIKKDGINLEPVNIRMQTYENLIKKEKEEKFWKN